MKEINLDKTSKIGSFAFDYSSQYFAVVGNALSVYDVKTLDAVVNFKIEAGLMTGVRFGNNSKYVATISNDKNLRVFS